ncbi:MAG: hypothetical protein K2H13_10075 [Eubacterium sp.]|nr:hypothetical protein [Eubacterium sp.]MDE6156114.1 hypothetical protein [Eubacterium sp.]
MSKTKKLFLTMFFVMLILTVTFIVLTVTTGNSVCYTLSITFGTVFYHFAMRLLVGKFTGHKFNYKSFWFKEKSFEKHLYKALRVKKWKGKMPSYNPQTYMTKNVPLETIINTMCRNEVIHEIIALLSFVPILFSLAFDAVLVFVITSIIACMCDLTFVVMQRYNRPRVVRLMERQREQKGRGN